MKKLLSKALLFISIILALSLWASNSANALISLPSAFLSMLLGTYLVCGMLCYLNIINIEVLRRFLIRYGYFRMTKGAMILRFAKITISVWGAMLSFLFSFYLFSLGTQPQFYYAIAFGAVFIAMAQLAKACLLGFAEIPTIKGQLITCGVGVLAMFTVPAMIS